MFEDFAQNKDGEWKVSANRINSYLQCPLKLSYRFQGYPTGPVEEKFIRNGLAVHNFLEDRVKGVIKEPQFYWDEQQVPEEMRSVFDTCIKNAEQFFDCGGKTEETILKHFVTPKGRKVVLEARIDLQTDDCIWDYKTGKHVDKDEYRLQAHIYHYATDFKYDVAKFISLQTNEIMEVKQPPKDYIPKLCDKYIDALEDNNLPKKQSRLCDYCEYDAYCRGSLQFVYVGDVKANPEKYGMKNPGWRD